MFLQYFWFHKLKSRKWMDKMELRQTWFCVVETIWNQHNYYFWWTFTAQNCTASANKENDLNGMKPEYALALTIELTGGSTNCDRFSLAHCENTCTFSVQLKVHQGSFLKKMYWKQRKTKENALRTVFTSKASCRCIRVEKNSFLFFELLVFLNILIIFVLWEYMDWQLFNQYTSMLPNSFWKNCINNVIDRILSAHCSVNLMKIFLEKNAIKINSID